MFVLSAIYEHHSTVLATSKYQDQLEKLAEIRTKIDAKRQDWSRQLKGHIEMFDADFPYVPRPQNPFPHKNFVEEQKYYAEERAWRTEDYKRRDMVREAAINKLRMDNPDISDEDMVGLSGVYLDEPNYEIVEVENISDIGHKLFWD
jgi:hypothetical protein